MASSGGGQADSQRQQQPPFWERVIAALGLLLVLASVAYLFYQGVWGDHSPPDIVVEPAGILDSGKDYLVRFKARNLGGETAAEVTISGVLKRDGEQVETTETTLDYIPAGSEQQGGLYFKNDPRSGELELSAAGYRTP